MLKKKPFSTVAIAFGQIIYKSGVQCFNDDPEFGSLIKPEFNLTEPVLGRVDGMMRSEDGKHVILTVTPINVEGQPLPDKEVEEVQIPFDLEKAPDFAENVWCDDKLRVTALCKKLNNQTKHGLKPLLELIQGRLDYIDSVNSVIEGEA